MIPVIKYKNVSIGLIMLMLMLDVEVSFIPVLMFSVGSVYKKECVHEKRFVFDT